MHDGRADGDVGGARSLAPARRSGVVGLVVRVVLGLGLVLGWVQLASMPLHGSLDDLVADLARGEVTRVTLERSADAGAAGSFGVVWEREGRPGHAIYHVDDGEESGTVVDDASRIRAVAQASPSTVEVVEAELSHPGTTWRLHGIAWLGTLVLLVLGPQPRLATKWAWFWLMQLAPPAAVAFVVLEPVPLWRREAPPGRGLLTGGWALLLAVMLAGVLEMTPFGELFA